MSILRNSMAVLIAVGVATTAASQAMAEEFTEQITTAWVGVGQTVEVEEGHPYFAGSFSGAAVATGEPGRFQHAALMCIGFNDIGVGAGGYCVYTLGTGDTATAQFSCVAVSPPAGAIVAGDCSLTFISGTGALAGISGTSPYMALIVPPNPDGSLSGVAVFEDGLTYSLPDM